MYHNTLRTFISLLLLLFAVTRFGQDTQKLQGKKDDGKFGAVENEK